MNTFIFKGIALASLCACCGFAQSVPAFLQPFTYAAGSDVTFVAVGDFNKDGIADLVTANNGSQNISILPGKSDGTFQAPVNIALSSAPLTLVVADLNHDGKLDVAVTNASGISILLGKGDGTFGVPADMALGSAPFWIATGDVNGDGVIDLEVSVTGNVLILLGTGDGAFRLTSTVPVQSANGVVLLADFNNDGHLDLVAEALFAVDVFLGNGDGTFLAMPNVGSSPGPMAVGDFNGDGKLDLAVSYFPFSFGDSGYLSIYPGNGDGTFGLFPFTTGGGNLLGVPVVADFNGDGKPDVALKYMSTSTISVMLGNGDGTLQSPILVETGNFLSTNMAARDLDRNGSTDLVLANLTGNDVVVLRNTMGKPPLLALTAMNPTTVVGGAASSKGTVFLGGPAPAAGAAVTLSSSNPSVAFFPHGPVVKIPAGASSANFSIGTGAVTSASSAVISASWHGVTQSATLNVVAPYRINSLTLNPASQYGIFTTTGTVTLTGPADNSAVVSLGSSNTALAATPASVTVPAGATSASFTITPKPVSADTAVTISASNGGATKTAVLTVLKPKDALQITRAEYTVRQNGLRVEATSTSATPTLTVYDSSTGVLLGTMINNGGGKYLLQATVAPPVLSVTIKSTLGGTTTGAVTQK